MTINDHPPLSADVILGTTRQLGYRLERGRWHDPEAGTVCAAAAYGLAILPAAQHREILFNSYAMQEAGVSWATIQGLIVGFEGYGWRWIDRLISRDYRHAYRVGREVWREAQRQAQAPPVPPTVDDDGPSDDGSAEPVLAGVGADDFEPDDHWRSSSGG